ncbi:hypothetical protein [Microbacterium sp. PA5]|uniref:hypothetical protein n=1 Tax=Microbacterium sp. PA5 TaxID=3416654 RepID=UPI003CF72A0B
MNEVDRYRLQRDGVRLIRQADPVRVASAEGLIDGELRARLRALLHDLDRLAEDVLLWRVLSQADPFRAAAERTALGKLGIAPWYELLVAGGYSFPPPPNPDELAASLAKNVRTALDAPEFKTREQFRQEVLGARSSLQRLIRVMVERLDLHSSGASSGELPLWAEVGTELAYGAASAIAAPAIVAQTAVAVEPLVGAGASIAGAGLIRAVKEGWRRLSDKRELSRPLSERPIEDPVLKVLALLHDTAQQARAATDAHFPRRSELRLLAEDLGRYGTMMSETLRSRGEHLQAWGRVEVALKSSIAELATDSGARSLDDLSRALDAAWVERSRDDEHTAY